MYLMRKHIKRTFILRMPLSETVDIIAKSFDLYLYNIHNDSLNYA